jgi:hypothetical protein
MVETLYLYASIEYADERDGKSQYSLSPITCLASNSIIALV